jgi:hypothetical protein
MAIASERWGPRNEKLCYPKTDAQGVPLNSHNTQRQVSRTPLKSAARQGAICRGGLLAECGVANEHECDQRVLLPRNHFSKSPLNTLISVGKIISERFRSLEFGGGFGAATGLALSIASQTSSIKSRPGPYCSRRS